MTSYTGRELFPPVDSGQFTIYVRAPSGTKLEASRDIIKAVENVIVDELGDPAPDNPSADSVYPVTKRKFAGGQNRALSGDEVAQAREPTSGDSEDLLLAHEPDAGRASASFCLPRLRTFPKRA